MPNTTDNPNETANNDFAPPAISLPKGGGAIRGIGEKFAANPVTGTGSMTMPITTSSGRSGFGPQLALSYDSGAGNGPFGLGWSLSLPSITRKTDKGLPRYRDADDSDVFILTSAEDLVPVIVENDGRWERQIPDSPPDEPDYTIERYRPRIEGLFARIERWTSRVSGAVHWRSITRDNITTIYGSRPDARIADPSASSQVFSWLICESYDDKGNAILYLYKPEDAGNVNRSLPQEKNRLDGDGFAHNYLKRIKYGNRSPRRAGEDLSSRTDWLFEVVFDYGEHDAATPSPGEMIGWPVRSDPFSSYRSGFEIRNYRLCRRVLMFHHFSDELDTTDYLVRSTDFTYSETGVASFITSISQSSYLRGPGGSYLKESLPPLEFVYTEATVDETVRSIDPDSIENLPAGLDGARYQWIDLDSEGVPGILTEQANAWFYKRNLSPITVERGNGTERNVARFAPSEFVAQKPSLADINGGRQHLLDLAGSGRLDLAQFEDPVPGYYERTESGGWETFYPFASIPKLAWNDPHLKFVDLTGDGRPDILISEDDVFLWHQSLAEQGFGSGEVVTRLHDEERGPALVFADVTQSVYVADLSGDGLTDIVRIRNGEVCYWPNLGYGRFGAKVTMDNPPRFDHPDLFEQKRIRLADIDGSGTTDIIYLGREKISFWINESGNRWGTTHQLSQFPAADDLSSVMVLDLLGNGTACILWSSPLPSDARQPMRYIDLMSGKKPHLLVSVKNNMGAETRVQYAASTRFYLQDKADGNPWITRLPFPVHVVERVEMYDYVSRTKFVTTYQYHHGYFDGPEREFRGFGMVEQFDTESFSRFSGAGLFTETPSSAGEEFHLPPVHTKTWFHNGAYIAQNRISRQYESEYYHGDPSAGLLPDTNLPGRLNAQEEREACRALKGRVLRQEVYADDDSARRANPYSVAEHCYRLRVVQPQQDNRHAVFYAHDSEVLEHHYERKPRDPRISHQLTLEVDKFGNVTKSAAVAHPRRPQTSTPEQPHPPAHAPEQRQTHIVYTESDFTREVDTADAYRAPLPSEVRTYELTLGLRATEGELCTVEGLLSAAADAREIQYEDSPSDAVLQKRIIERVRTLYRRDNLSGALPLGQLEPLALPWESYKQAFTPGLLIRIYGGKLASSELGELLNTEGGYRDLDSDGVWWIPAGEPFFSQDPGRPDPVFAQSHFYLPQGSIDPFGNISRVTHDDYDLLIARTEDAFGNVMAAHNDYRVMQPDLITDPNDNRAAVRFDTLGLVVATAVMGKLGRGEGDTLDDPTTRLEYDLFNWLHNGRPNFVHTFAREQHGPANPRWQESFSYSDGLGREVMKKIQAEPGAVRRLDAGDNVIEVDTSPAVRWVGTGRTIFNNKGKPVKKYEPFFSATSEYETEDQLVVVGVTPILRYDPLGRLIRTDRPNGTFSKVEFDPWKQTTWDENDTVRESRWYGERGSPDPAGSRPSDPEARAAWLAARHANTATVAHLDTLGRAFLTVADNGLAVDGTLQNFETRVELDIEGNQRSVTDARGNRVMEYAYNMLGGKIFQRSMDAGERWMLNNVTGHSIRAWDSRDHIVRTVYDQLQRPTQLFVRLGGASEDLVERTMYGEPPAGDATANAEAKNLNLRGKARQHYDGAGVVTNEEYDFKSNLLRSTRQFAVEYRRQLDWSASPALQPETFAGSTTYDALNRPITLTTPDRSVIRPGFNEANLLERVNVNLRGAMTETVFVSNIDYDAKGQRKLIEYGINDAGGSLRVVRTEYDYDPFTFRLIHLSTTRTTDGNRLQDLSYTYDPVGNITAIRDDAQQTIYFRNTIVEPSAEYEYDALYRLISANGREHLGQNGSGRLNPPRQTDHNDSFRTNLTHPGDGNAMGNYTERYEYDTVGNVLRMIHEAGASGSWTRHYSYDEPSLIEPGRNNNRLSRTSLPGDPSDGPYSARYTYDAHGNMTSMPHLPTMTPDRPGMEWDFRDQLHAARQQVVTDGGTGETAYYVYDSAGQRARKVIERPGGAIKQERLYLGGFEVYRERSNSSVTLERETLHIMDDQRRIALVETKTIDAAAAPTLTLRPLIRYQVSNHLGSASLELDDAGEIVSYEEYYPYGTTSYQAVRRGVEANPKRFRYTGKERDEETGLYYHGARYYAPWLGRWTSADPVGLMDGTNIYHYVRNNPLRLVDWTGLISESELDNAMNRFAERWGGNDIRAQRADYNQRVDNYNRNVDPWRELSQRPQWQTSAERREAEGVRTLGERLIRHFTQDLEQVTELIPRAERLRARLQGEYAAIRPPNPTLATGGRSNESVNVSDQDAYVAQRQAVRSRLQNVEGQLAELRALKNGLERSLDVLESNQRRVNELLHANWDPRDPNYRLGPLPMTAFPSSPTVTTTPPAPAQPSFIPNVPGNVPSTPAVTGVPTGPTADTVRLNQPGTPPGTNETYVPHGGSPPELEPWLYSIPAVILGIGASIIFVWFGVPPTMSPGLSPQIAPRMWMMPSGIIRSPDQT